MASALLLVALGCSESAPEAVATAAVATPECSADSDCPETGSACVLRRCLVGTCVAIDLEGLSCEDGSVCTLGDRCTAGACVPGPNLCACAETADCAAEGSSCDGEFVCDKSTFPHQCVAKAGTATVCKDDGEPCTSQACDPATGKCATTAANEGLGCSDGDACTQGDVCTKGACVPGPSTCACATDNDCAQYNDEDLLQGHALLR